MAPPSGSAASAGGSALSALEIATTADHVPFVRLCQQRALSVERTYTTSISGPALNATMAGASAPAAPMFAADCHVPPTRSIVVSWLAADPSKNAAIGPELNAVTDGAVAP